MVVLFCYGQNYDIYKITKKSHAKLRRDQGSPEILALNVEINWKFICNVWKLITDKMQAEKESGNEGRKLLEQRTDKDLKGLWRLNG